MTASRRKVVEFSARGPSFLTGPRYAHGGTSRTQLVQITAWMSLAAASHFRYDSLVGRVLAAAYRTWRRGRAAAAFPRAQALVSKRAKLKQAGGLPMAGSGSMLKDLETPSYSLPIGRCSWSRDRCRRATGPWERSPGAPRSAAITAITLNEKAVERLIQAPTLTVVRAATQKTGRDKPDGGIALVIHERRRRSPNGNHINQRRAAYE